MLPLTDIPDDQARFLQALGEVSFRWNSLEALTRLLLYYAARGSGRLLDCVIVQLPVNSLKDTCKALLDFSEDAEAVDCVGHFADAFDRARTYRNYYIHGPRMMGNLADSGLVALSQEMLVRKGGLRVRNGHVAIEELQQFNAHLFELEAYVSPLLFHLIGASPLEREGFQAQPLSSIQKPGILPELTYETVLIAQAMRARDGNALPK